MAERQRFTLLFGEGLDRSTGIMAVRPATMRDVRNAELREGRAQARRGFRATATLIDEAGNPLDHTCALFGLREEGVGIAVGYSLADCRVHINRLDGDGVTAEWVGVWFTNPPGLGVPRVIGADVQGKLFLAHDEARVTKRAATYVYDPLATPFLAPLTADLDNDGTPEPLRFRGVCAHLAYLFGWGFGTAASPAAADVVRHSLPGQPTVFRRNDYGRFGKAGDPVLLCVSHPLGLMVYKETERHLLRGYSVGTFAPEVVDPAYGIAGSRLALYHAGFLFSWSNEGPRVSTGGASEDMALPLDLGGPAPPDLTAEGAAEDGFVEYLPEMRKVLFVFGARVYAATIRAQPWKWGYDELGREAACGARLYTSAPLPPPAGYPDVEPVTEIQNTSVTAHWSNVDADGDETVEIWLRPAGGSWARKASVACSGLAAQSHAVIGLSSGVLYDRAQRYRRGTGYTPGYESAIPSDWPAVSRDSFTTRITAPRIDAITWSRTSATEEKHALVLVLADASMRTQILRSGAFDFASATSVQILAAGVAAWEDTEIEGEVAYVYWARHLAEDDTPGPASAGFARHAGPRPPHVTDAYSNSSSGYHFQWQNGPDPFTSTEFQEDSFSGEAGEYDDDLAQDIHGGVWFGSSGPHRPHVTFRIRHVLESFGVEDHSPWDTHSVDICTGCPA